MPYRHQKNLDAFQFVGGDTAVDAVLAGPVAGEYDGAKEHRQCPYFSHGFTVALIRSSENTSRYVPLVRN